MNANFLIIGVDAMGGERTIATAEDLDTAHTLARRAFAAAGAEWVDVYVEDVR